jgi:hypothetical protein
MVVQHYLSPGEVDILCADFLESVSVKMACSSLLEDGL